MPNSFPLDNLIKPLRSLWIFMLALTITPILVFGQVEQAYRIIPSFTEWVAEINNWPDSIYKQENIKVLFNEALDSSWVRNGYSRTWFDHVDTLQRIVIDKEIDISDFQIGIGDQLSAALVLRNIHFRHKVEFGHFNNHRFQINNCRFSGVCLFRQVRTKYRLSFRNCHFEKDFALDNPFESLELRFRLTQFDEDLVTSNVQTNALPLLRIQRCEIAGNLWPSWRPGSKYSILDLFGSKIGHVLDIDYLEFTNSVMIRDNEIANIAINQSNLPVQNTYIPFNQISKKLIEWIPENQGEARWYRADREEDYRDQFRFDRIIASYSKLLSIYQARGEKHSYNACYIEMRDKQTRYSKYIYKQDPTFSKYAVYQLNAFMGTFSDYGTRPTKAIIISIYVILFFALIYLFFPNSWDSHGKNRIIDRYTFFMKYMNQKAGIHEVYLEDKKEELMSYDQFKDFIISSEQTVPKFFTATALPLYRWAISGTKLSASLLKRIDIMRGTWSELPARRRWWKGLLLIGAFAVAIIYDYIIKVLNALMLSINTFTTLGFGEIPIKGLPRYLAIVQGFIGWFMLTIFSVSLISQLLN